MYDKNIWGTEDCIKIIPNKDLLKYYLYHYLKFIQDELYELGIGMGQQGVNSDIVNNIDIPVCTLERQQEIIAIFEERNATFAQWDLSTSGYQKLIDILTNKKKLLFVGKA